MSIPHAKLVQDAIAAGVFPPDCFFDWPIGHISAKKYNSVLIAIQDQFGEEFSGDCLEGLWVGTGSLPPTNDWVLRIYARDLHTLTIIRLLT